MSEITDTKGFDGEAWKKAGAFMCRFSKDDNIVHVIVDDYIPV